MANAKLAQYVEEQMNAGYDIAEIKASLTRQGYTQNAVDEAARKAKQSTPLI